MRLIAFITDGTQTDKILDHIGVDSEPPHIAPARGPPLRDDCDAQLDDGAHIESDWDLAAQPAPDFEVDQRVSFHLSTSGLAFTLRGTLKLPRSKAPARPKPMPYLP